MVSLDRVLEWRYLGNIAYAGIGCVIILLVTRRVPQNKDVSKSKKRLFVYPFCSKEL